MTVSAMLKHNHNCPSRDTRHQLRWGAATASAFSFSWMFLLLTCQIQMQLALGLSTYTTSRIMEQRQRPSRQHLRSLGGSSIDDDDDTDGKGENQLPTFKGSLAGSKLHEYILREHKPLGCSVEESLANEPDNAKYVFVADVVKGGYAARAGLREGDVIVQLSGTFDEVVDVAGLGIDKIRSLVGGRPKENPLIMRVARGSDIMNRHQLALVELCIVGDDAETAECITSIYSADNDLLDMDDNIEMTICEEDDGTECMLDSMWNSWTEDLPSSAKEEEGENDVVVEKDEKKKVAPWSSRSSPSGTYVRDPKTGKLVNIDE